jgi:hypothetical protein
LGQCTKEEVVVYKTLLFNTGTKFMLFKVDNLTLAGSILPAPVPVLIMKTIETLSCPISHLPKSFLTLRTVSSSLSTFGKNIIDRREEAEELPDAMEDKVEDGVEEEVEDGEEESSTEAAELAASDSPAVILECMTWPGLTSDLGEAVERPLLPVRPWRSVIRLGSLSPINLNSTDCY